MKFIALTAALLLSASAVMAASTDVYPNQPPLKDEVFADLPLGAVKPAGWLRAQLQTAADGLTGHLDEFWPSVRDSAWRGKDGDAWERGPYYLDGLVPLAYLLDDSRLIAKVEGWMNVILESGQDNGWFGPAKNNDRWPLAPAMKALIQYQEASGDERVIPLLTHYFRYMASQPPDWPDSEWRGVRARENLIAAYWLYNRTGETAALDAARSILANSFNWTNNYLNFPFKTYTTDCRANYHQTHGVNNGMAIKYPALEYLLTGDETALKASYAALENLDRYHGQVGGRFSCDEHLAGLAPTQGTELCTVVESMFSLENLIRITGDAAFSDRLESLAYNALPGTTTADFRAHQYDQQANQVLCTVAKRNWTDNGDASNIFGLEPHFGCCTANMHQGWPKFVSHLWMASRDGGLAAAAYGPSRVTAKVGRGVVVSIDETTSYPFDDRITFTIHTSEPVAFPLTLRIPGWAQKASISIAGTAFQARPGQFVTLSRNWRDGEQAVLTFQTPARVERRYNDAATILRGPLVFSLRIGERFKEIARHDDKLPSADYEIYPTTDWNYALQLDADHPENSIETEIQGISDEKPPFSDDWPPIVLKVKGRQLPGWTLEQNSAGETPRSPVVSDRPPVELELVPYGSTRLRISEFPILKSD
ncbi:MAG: hypothetical protein GC154_15660 [bacterium]|nr:hypothetical protein [bacterium]